MLRSKFHIRHVVYTTEYMSVFSVTSPIPEDNAIENKNRIDLCESNEKSLSL